MAKISTYPIISIPTIDDLLIGTDVNDLNNTKNFTIGDIGNLIGQDYVPYVGATGNVNLGSFNITGGGFIVGGGTASQFLKADGSLDSTLYTPQTRTLTINGTTYNLSANRSWDLNTIDSLTTTGTSGAATYIGKVLNIPVYQAQGSYITQLSGEATGSGPGNASVTLSNSAVISKVLTGLNVTGGTVVSTDTILQAFGKVQNQINGLTTGVTYQGVWNAATNVPFLQSSVGTQGYYYVVDVAGTTNLNGITDWQVGDWAIYNGTAWQKVDNTDAVVSVNGYVGAVVLTASDVGAVPTTRTLTINGVGYNLSADRAWTVGDVRTDGSYANPSWITSLGWSKITGTPTTLAGYGITDGALNTTTLTINGTTFDLTANRTWNVGTVTSVGTSGPLTGGTITGSGTIGITQAGASSDGYLSSTDWNTFNSKQGAISVNAPLTFVSGVIGITQAGASSDGYLSSTDWNTFNSKVSGSGTANTLPMWGSSSSLINSPLSYAADTFNFQYNSATGGTVNFTNIGLSAYTYSIQMNNFGSPRSTIHSYTDGLIIQSIGGTQVSRMFANGNLILGTGTVDNGYKLEVTGDLYLSSIVNATVDTDRFIVSDGGLIKYRTGAQILSDIGAQGSLTLTTTGSSGPATLIGDTLNIPNYSSSLTGYVPYTGATQNVNLGEYGLSGGYFLLDTTPTGTPTSQGTIYWDDSRSTAALIMNGTIQHIGQDTYFYVKNSTGSSIPKGTAVRFAGTDGASGHLLIAPFLADGTYPSSYFMGVTSETIANGAFGQVSNFGELSGINTSAYTAGALLYASTTVAGGFQTTPPVAPNNIVLVAAAVNSKNNGDIVIRPLIGSNINNDEGVKIVSPVTGQLLQLQSNGLWENKTLAQVLGGTSSQFVKGDGSLDSNTYLTTSAAASTYVPYTGATGAVDLGINAFAASQISINGAAPTSGSFLGFKHATTVNTGTNGYTSMYTFGTNIIGFKSINGANNIDFSFDMSAITPNVPGGRVYTLPNASGTIALVGGSGVGTVTSVAALTLGTSGTDLSSTVANSTTTPVITLNVPTASATNRGALSAADWTTFNNKQNALTNPVTGTGTTNYLPKFTGASTIGNSQVFDDGTNVGIGTITPGSKFDVTNTVGTAYDASNTLVSGQTMRIANLSTSSSIASTLLFIATGGGGGNGLGTISGVNTATGSLALTFGTRDSGGSVAERARITSGGNLLVGTTTDNGARLQVSGQGTFTDSANGFNLNLSKTAGFGALIQLKNTSVSSSDLIRVLNSSDTIISRIEPATGGINFAQGNVGINQNTPTNLLHLAGASATPSLRLGSISAGFHYDIGRENQTTGDFLINASVAGTSQGTYFRLAQSGGAATFSSSVTATQGIFTGSAAERVRMTRTSVGSWDLAISATNRFSIYDVAGAEERISITSSGNVGIGTSSPTNGLLVINSTAANGVRFALESSGTMNGVVALGSNAISGLATTDLALWTRGVMAFETGASGEKMRITSGGNVLIGTTTDNGARLQVSGQGTFTLNQNASTVVSITNSDNTNASSRAIYRASSGTVTSSFLSISTLGAFIGSETNHDLHLITNGNTRLQIAGSTGAANFSNSLRIQGSAVPASGSGTELAYDGTNGYLLAFNRTSSVYLPLFVQGSSLSFGTGDGTTKMLINSSGNVGIGTASPANKLEVTVSSNQTNLYVDDSYPLKITNTSTTNNSYVGMYLGSGNGVGVTIQAVYPNASVNTEANLLFSTRNSAGSLAERMRITSGGNVLIGTTTSNGARLQVSGTNPAFDIQNSGSTFFRAELDGSNFTYLSTLGANDMILRTNGTARLTLNGSTGAATFSSSITSNLSSGIFLNNSSGGTNATQIRINNTSGDLRLGIESSTGGTIQIGTLPYAAVFGNQANNPVQFTTNGTAQMTITSSGNVGIGTSSPQSPIDVISPTNGYVSFGRNISVGQWTGIHFGYREDNTLYRKSAIVFERTGGAAQGNIHFLNNNAADTTSASLSDSRMAITSGGNVGIGTASISNPISFIRVLNISGGDAGLIFSNTNGTAKNWSIGAIDSGSFVFFDGASERMRITSSGNVGIGTASPIDYGAGWRNLAINGPSSGSQIDFMAAGVKQGFVAGGTTAVEIGSSINTQLRFYTNGTIKATITSGGNFGIGTNSPERQFVVSNGGANGLEITPVSSGTIMEIISYNRSTAAYTPLQFDSSRYTFNRGNVLIGTTTDVGARLYVDGAFRTGTLTAGTQTAAVDWRLGNARGGTATANALVRVQINGVLVDLIGNYV